MQDEVRKAGKVKKGFLVVQVGLLEEEEEEREIELLDEGRGSSLQRFVIPIWYLYHPLFVGLLDRAREVYGYHVDGPLRLPCSVDDFAHLRWRIERESGGGSGGHHHYNHHILHQYFHQATSFRSC